MLALCDASAYWMVVRGRERFFGSSVGVYGTVPSWLNCIQHRFSSCPVRKQVDPCGTWNVFPSGNITRSCDIVETQEGGAMSWVGGAVGVDVAGSSGVVGFTVMVRSICSEGSPCDEYEA